MKKILLILLLVFVILVAMLFFWINYVPEKDRYCQIDNDCIPYGLKCGACTDNNIAINKDKLDKYFNRYQLKCIFLGTRNCSSVPEGYSQCIDNLCTLIPNITPLFTSETTVCKYLDNNFESACDNSDCSAQSKGSVWEVSYRCPGSENYPLGQIYMLEVSKNDGNIEIKGLSN